MSDPATPHDDVIGKAYDARLMRRLLQYLVPYWPKVLLALTAIVGASMLQLAQPYLMKVAIDDHIARGSAHAAAVRCAADDEGEPAARAAKVGAQPGVEQEDVALRSRYQAQLELE